MANDFSLGEAHVSSSPQERFEEYLQSRGKRITQQRRALVEYSGARHDHFDADELIASLGRGPEGDKISRPTVYRTLNELVEAGLLTRRPYREPGQRAREEYVLTPSGVEFMPVVWAMFEWGRKHLPNRSRLRLAHRGCGAEASVEIRCAKGHEVPADELVVRVGGR